MRYPTREEIEELSPAERLQLIEDVWSTLEQSVSELPLLPEHQRVIDSRMEQLRTHPDAGAPWDQVRSRLTRSK